MAAGRGNSDIHHQHVRAKAAGESVDCAAALGEVEGLRGGDAGIGRSDRLGRDTVVGTKYHHLLAVDNGRSGAAYAGKTDDGPFELAQAARQLGAGIPAALGLDLRLSI